MSSLNIDELALMELSIIHRNFVHFYLIKIKLYHENPTRIHKKAWQDLPKFSSKDLKVFINQCRNPEEMDMNGLDFKDIPIIIMTERPKK